MEFREFQNKLFSKIINWDGVIDCFNHRDNYYQINFSGNKAEKSLEFYIDYKDLKLSVSFFSTKLYTFELDEREYKRFMLELEDHIYHSNKLTFDNFFGI